MKPTYYYIHVVLGIICFLFSHHTNYAQTSVRGTVLDLETREPLIGANVQIPSTSIGTMTDSLGNFSLSHDEAISRLRISYLGYESLNYEVPVEKSEINIGLSPSVLELDQVTVTAFETQRNIMETAGGIAVLNERQINNFNNVSLGQAFNTVPGVRFEENDYGGGSRLLIRGTQLRAEFATRNVKFYWNDIPFTDPAGDTRLEFIDASTIGSMEIIRGPAGSLYGPGHGGVVILRSSKADFGEKSVGLTKSVGSFGLSRTVASAQFGSENTNFNITYVDQNSDGYRDQGFADKQVFNLMGQIYPSEAGVLSFNLGYYDGGYGLPGTLNEEEYLADPSQARAGTEAYDARVSFDGLTAGISYKAPLSKHWEQVTSLFAKSAHLDHPFGFAGADAFGGNTYNNSPASEFGGRTRVTAKYNIAGMPFRLSFGGEYQSKTMNRRVYANEFGTPGETWVDREILTTQYLLFTQAELDLPANFFLTMGLSTNSLSYEIEDYLNTESDPYNADASFSFESTLAPRIALVKKLSDAMSIHASASYGYSPPVTLEVVTNAGVNTDLQAENTINYELGYRATFQDRLNLDVTTYYYELEDAILPIVTSSSHNAFENKGNTSQFGVEAAWSYFLIRDPARTVSLLKPWVSYTFNRFRFKDYQKESLDFNTGEVIVEDFSGNELTGTAPHQVAAGIDVETRFGLYGNITMNALDKRPLTDDNSLYLDGYVLVNSKIGYRIQICSSLQAEAFGGVGNALGETYVSFPALNGFGGRYYNPAPDRNFFGGVTLRYMFK